MTMPRPTKTHSPVPRARAFLAGRGLSALLLASLVLAGCTGNGSPPGGSSKPRLADFEACDFKHPNGTPVPCHDERIMLEARAGEPPPPWYCYGEWENKAISYRYCTNPVEGFAFAYDTTPSAWMKDGLVRMDRKSGEPLMYGWNITTPVGYVILPKAEEAVTLNHRMNGMEYNATPSALAAAKVEALWSVYGTRDDADWLLFRIMSGDRAYYFDAMRPHPADPEFLVPQGVWIEGEDFQINLQHLDLPFSAGAVISLPPPVGIPSAVHVPRVPPGPVNVSAQIIAAGPSPPVGDAATLSRPFS